MATSLKDTYLLWRLLPFLLCRLSDRLGAALTLGTKFNFSWSRLCLFTFHLKMAVVTLCAVMTFRAMMTLWAVMAFGAVIALSTVVAFYALIASEGHSRAKKHRIRHWEGNQDEKKNISFVLPGMLDMGGRTTALGILSTSLESSFSDSPPPSSSSWSSWTTSPFATGSSFSLFSASIR